MSILFCMKSKKILLNDPSTPVRILAIPDAPKQLFIAGEELHILLQRPAIAIVGSRKVSPYGTEVTTQLAHDLAKAGIVIISGLAIGVDGIAHRAALEAGGKVIAVLPCGLDKIYPASHHALAQQIIQKGGALVTEYPEATTPYKMNFVARNRIISGLSDAVLITEAAEKSGSLHTADFALQQGREVLAVPGNITSPTSAGTNNLIKTGAIPVTSAQDVLQALHIEITSPNRSLAPKGGTPTEQLLLDLLFAGIQDGDELIAQSGLPISQFSQTLTMLEIHGHIRPLGSNRWALK